jgi:hypothetical protein
VELNGGSVRAKSQARTGISTANEPTNLIQ